MAKGRIVFQVVLGLLLSVIGFNSFGQCGAPTVTQKDFCNGQRAEIKITDPAPNVKYHWYWDAAGTLTDGGIGSKYSYGYDGMGRYFVSSFPVTAPTTYYYVKETTEVAGPVYRAPSGGALYAMNATKYDMTFDATMDFTLDSFTVVVELADATKDYMFELLHINGTDSTYSTQYVAKRSTFQQLSGNIYKARIPIGNLKISAGTNQIIEFRSATATNNTYYAVDRVYWWAAGAYTGASYASNAITVKNSQDQVGADTRTPLIMDWSVTLLCPAQSVEATLKSLGCCTPVGSDFKLSTPSTNNIFKASELPVTINANGADINSSMQYYWYDRDGTLITNGVNKNSLPASSFGYYTLRVVENSSFVNSASCFSEQTILIDSSTISVSGGGTYCVGDNIKLSASGGVNKYTWSSSNLGASGVIISPNFSTTPVEITKPGIYNFEVEADVLAGDIIVDGTFSAYNPNTNSDATTYPPRFETTYGFTTTPGSNGDIYVGKDVFAWGSYQCPVATYPAFYQETVGGNTQSRGNILFTDAHSGGAADALTIDYALEKYLWQMSNQPVKPNQTYSFTMDVAQWGESDLFNFMILVNGVPLNLTVDGVNIGDTIYTETDLCNWHKVTGTWNSGTNTTATLTIAEVGKANFDHEVAIDNISFSTGFGVEKQKVEVIVDDCRELEVVADKTICAGDPFTLDVVKNNGFIVDWKDSGGNVVATTQSAQIYPSATETYTVRAKFPVVSYLDYGDFEGPLDFTTDLRLAPNGTMEAGDYIVGKGNESKIHGQMTKTKTDHTTGSGNMLIMWPKLNQYILTKTIAVTGGQSYAFNAWMLHLHDGLYGGTAANVAVYTYDLIIDGAVATTFTLGKTTNWTNFNYAWVAPTSKNVVVRLRSTANSSSSENGMAMDDVSISQLGLESTDAVTVTVNVCQTLTLKDEGCAGTTRKATYTTDGIFTGWYTNADVLVSTDDTLKVIPSTATTYKAKVSIALASLITNGDMEAGNITGMKAPAASDFTGSTQDFNYDKYAFVTNANALNGETANLPGTGKYLVVNSKQGTNSLIYESNSITLAAGVTHQISFDLTYANIAAVYGYFSTDGLSQVEVFIGTTSLGKITLPQAASWKSYAFTYTPAGGVTGPLKIVVLDKKGTALSAAPWDVQGRRHLSFALDNVKVSPTKSVLEETISLAPCCTPATITVQPTAKTVCEGTNTTFTVGASGGTLTYKWQTSTNGTTWTDISNGGVYSTVTTATLTISDVTGLTGRQYRVEILNNGSCPLNSSAAVLTVTATPTTPILSGTQKYCVGESLSLNVTTASQTTGATYAWNRGATVLTGTAATYSKAVAVADAGNYTVIATKDNCPSAVSTAYAVEVNAIPVAPGITAVPNKTAVCAGEAITLTASSTTTGSSYTWSKGSASGTGSKDVAITAAAADGGTYTVTASVTTNGKTCTSVASTNFTLTVNALPTAVLTGGGEFCKEGTPSLGLTLTGASPYVVNYSYNGAAQPALTGVTSPGAISPIVAGNIVPGTYAVTSVTDANNCTANFTTVSQAVTVTPDLVVVNPTATCDFATKEATVTFDVNDGKPAYTITKLPAAATQTVGAGDVYTMKFAANGSTLYDFAVKDASTCTANQAVEGAKGSINCDCPVTATIAQPTGAKAELCAGETTTLEVTVGGSVATTPAYTFTVKTPTSTLAHTAGTKVGNVYTFSVSEDGAYTIQTVADQSCTGSGSGSVTITVNPLPVATFKPATDTICDDGTTTSTVTLELTAGTAPYTYEVSGPEATTAAVAVNTHAVKTIGVYTLTSLTDAKGCAMATPVNAGDFTLRNYEEPEFVAVKATCDPLNPSPSSAGPFNYAVSVEATKGDAASYAVSLTLSNATTIANAAGTWSGGVWTMTNPAAIDESVTVTSISLVDKNNCTPATYTTVVGATCSCVETATMTLTGSDSVCTLGAPTTSALDIAFAANGTGATSWKFQLVNQANAVIEDYSVTPLTGASLSVSNLPKGEYSIVGLEGTCLGKATNTIKIEEYPVPAAVLSGTASICDDGTTETPITIVVLSGEAPYTIQYDVANSGTGTAVGGVGTSYNTKAFGTHTLFSFTDNNGCQAPATNLTGSAVVTAVAKPVAAITGFTDGQTSTINAVPQTYSAVAAATGYTGVWSASDATKGSASGATDYIVNNTLQYEESVDLTWTVSDDNSKCSDSSITITVERKNITAVGTINPDTICGAVAHTYTPVNTPNTSLGETAEWIAEAGSPAVTMNATTYQMSTTFTAVGDYTFTYRIYNPTILGGNGLPIESKGTYIVRVDNVVTTPVSAGTISVVCSEPYTLAGSSLNTDETGLWTATGLTFTAATTPNSGVSGLTQGVPTTLTWTVSSKYKKCVDKGATVVLTKAQDLTAATITPNDLDSTYCLSGTNIGTPVLSALAVNAGNGETGTWSSSDVIIAPADLNSNSLDLSGYGLAANSYTLTWTVSSSNCTDTKSDDIEITITDVPDVTNASITFADGCEGTTVNNVEVTGVTGADSYTWSSQAGGSIVGTSTSSTTSFKLAEDGSTAATVQVIPSNVTCGTSQPVTATNTINLKPSQAPSITGDNVVCGSKSYTYNQPVTMPSDVTGYEWKWKGTNKGTVPSITLSGTDLTGDGKLELIPSNTCGDGPAGTKLITVQTPSPAKVELGFKDNKVEWCEDEQALELEVNAVQSNGGTGATYEYFNGTTSLGTSATVAQGTWKDGDQFKVSMTPDAATGCFTGGASPVSSNVIIVDGYKIPSITLTANKAAICETDGDIVLTIGGMKKGDKVNTWKKDNALLIGSTGTTYKAGQSEQRGMYEVEVGNNVCSGIDTKSTDIMIYEQPNITNFYKAIDNTPIGLGGRYVYSIEDKESEASGIVPTSITGIVLDQATTSYIWSAPSISIEQNKADMHFSKKGETEGLEQISLVVINGVPGAECKDSADFLMGISLPLLVPNTFSPNGDNINDTWVIQGMNDFPDAQITIFNRWGQKLYERFKGYPADKAWDGEGFPVGTYYYILKLNDPVRKAAGQDDVVRGAVTITR